MVHSLVGRALGSRFLRRTLLVGGAASAAQMLLLALTPLLSRLYDPVDFGTFGAFLALLALFGQPFFLRFESTLPLCRAGELPAALTAAALAGGGMLLAAVAVALALTLAAPAGEGTPAALARVAWLVPLVLAPAALPRLFLYLAIRRGHYADYALIQGTQTVAQGLGQLLLGLFGTGWIGLALGQALGGLAAAAVGRRRQPLPALAGRLSRRRLAVFLRRNYRYPCYLAPSTVIYTFIYFAPPVLIATLFDVRLAGFYVLAQRLWTAPLRIVSQAISQVLFGELARHQRRRAPHRVRQLTLVLGAALALLGLLVYALDDSFWTLLLGEDWRGFAAVVTLLFPLFALRFLLESLWNVLLVGEAQLWLLAGALGQAVAVVGAYGGGWIAGLAPLEAMVLHVALVGAVLGGQLVTVYHTARRLGG